MAEFIKEPWYKKVWRPSSAAVYLLICLFDFMVMPAIVEANNDAYKPSEIAQIALQFKDSATQMAFVNSYSVKRTWSPLTLEGSAAFHLAFGALLTGAAVTRGMQHKESVKNGTQVV